ncbi:glycosyltransferase [Candidatus Saccharibacteria bacterium]|nr:glycosyltransferase [Candidatus Saccharibacteria bacterium]
MKKTTTKKIDISVIITAHNEGILAHKTMLSVFRSAKKLEEYNISYEIIVHIDNGTDETTRYFDRYNQDKRVRVLENSFGDLSSSRNYSAKEAFGKYLAFIDADDLCSELWLASSYEVVRGEKDVVARLNYIVTFGASDPVVTENKNMSDNEKALYLVDSNMYGSPMMCSREIYLDTPQRTNRPPYGYEDWQWVMDTITKGVKHKVAPETALFYRKDPISNPSLLASQSVNRSTLSTTKSLSFDSIKKLEIPAQQNDYNLAKDLPSRIRRRLKYEVKLKSYHTIKYLKSFSTISAVKERIKPSRNRGVDLPNWLISEWKELNKIEKLIFPTESLLKKTISWHPNKQAGIGYTSIIKQLNKKPDTLFFVPWLIRGGADKVFINTANELAEAHPDWNVAMIQTLHHPSSWQNKLSNKVDFVDIAMTLKDLGYEHQLRLMALFLVQNGIKRIMIGNSKFAYDLALRYKTLIRELDIKVYAFAFTEIIDPDGRITDYIHEDLPLINDVVYRIVTDNTSIVNQLDSEHGIDKDKIFVHHQYLNNKFEKPVVQARKPLKVMWASRVSRQKVPEVLLEIGQKLTSDFQIDVYGEIEVHYSQDFFDGSGVNYIRRFNGIDDLPTAEYDIFLYTSSADGMPNMLLEIASKGLPIVAPDVGGIKDLIKDGETGLLIDDYRGSDAYVEALDKLKDKKLRLSLAENAQNLLKKDFTETKWQKILREIFDK